MVVIRLSRGGAKRRPFYQVVVADRRRSRDGRFIENLGYFNPIATNKDVKLTLNMGRFEYWVKSGAQPSERVKHLLEVFAKQAQTAPAGVSGEAQAAQETQAA